MKNRTLDVALAALITVAGLALSGAPAFAQQAAAGAGAAVTPAQLQAGQKIYDANCSQCHQAGGTGAPPDIPALTKNEHLSDLTLIVTNIHQGKGNMLSFPGLTADDIAAVATYIRNSFDNKLGGVTTEQTASILGGLTTTASGVSVWSGVFTAAQDDRGTAIQSAVCGRCHGPRLNGAGQPDQPPSPAIAREGFLRKWDGQTVAALFDFVKTKMPQDNPGVLTDQQAIDAIAHMFAVSAIPPGAKELPPDPKALAGLVIHPTGP